MHLAENGEPISPNIRQMFVCEPRSGNEFDHLYYQRLHNEFALYKENNWLLGSVNTIAAARPRTIVELGCGNGKFIKAISTHVASVIGADWAKSPLLDDLPANCSFLQADITGSDLPSGDLACSADVLEHLSFDILVETISHWLSIAPLQYHIIACYDDEGSHLTVMPPSLWYCLFRHLDESFRLESIDVRRNNPKQIVCTITNLPEIS